MRFAVQYIVYLHGSIAWQNVISQSRFDALLQPYVANVETEARKADPDFRCTGSGRQCAQ